MHVTVTTADIAGEPLENAGIVAEELDRWLRDTDGFEGFMMIAREGRAVGLAFWASREAAERQAHVRSQFRERMLSVAGVRIEAVEEYEVVFSSLGSGSDDAVG